MPFLSQHRSLKRCPSQIFTHPLIKQDAIPVVYDIVSQNSCHKPVAGFGSECSHFLCFLQEFYLCHFLTD